MRTNYVLVDYENVQPQAMAALDQEHFKVIVFVGASQVKVTFDIASLLQRMGSRASYIKITGNGSNALDFHIAFYIGQITKEDPDAYFHIISKDSGFDPLIEHLKSKKISANRSSDIADMPIFKVANTKTPSEKIAVIVASLQQHGANRPRTVKTLSNSIGSLFQKALSEIEIATMLKTLQEKKYISISSTKVSYSLPT